ncbi:hypothetical protein ACFQFH_17450 [Halobaculum halobium]|uniref:Uncharacterized protein n=1 Tax=Halobaculum halobium TaxID=3032281 RepID=A0ABD5TE68_9EURY|nr:hypothetical protein [Halobaculum sp. SYNS20]
MTVVPGVTYSGSSVPGVYFSPSLPAPTSTVPSPSAVACAAAVPAPVATAPAAAVAPAAPG